MDLELAQAWVDKLRSNEYTQGRGRLRWDKMYCCLGVGCDLYGQKYGVEWGKSSDSNGYYFLDFPSSMPSQVIDAFGLTMKMQDSLITENDIHHASFKTIAEDLVKYYQSLGYNIT